MTGIRLRVRRSLAKSQNFWSQKIKNFSLLSISNSLIRISLHNLSTSFFYFNCYFFSNSKRRKGKLLTPPDKIVLLKIINKFNIYIYKIHHYFSKFKKCITTLNLFVNFNLLAKSEKGEG